MGAPVAYSAPVNRNVNWKLYKNGIKRGIHLTGVDQPETVGLFSNTLEFKPESYDPKSRTSKFSFKPDGKFHTCSIVSGGRSLKQFSLASATPKLVIRKGMGRQFEVHDLYDTNNLSIKSSHPLTYSVKRVPGTHNAIV